MRFSKTAAAALLVVITVTGCRGLGQTPPPPAHTVESLATSMALTENAPPPGFESVEVLLVDDGLADLPGYHYVVDVRFEGVFDADLQSTSAHIRASVWWDSVAPARRVVLDVEGEVFSAEPQHFEAVRIGEDYYLLDENGRCLINADEVAQAVANFDAGSLIGGIGTTPYSGTQAVLNSVQAYRYDVSADNSQLPLVHQGENSALTVNGELWLTPDLAVVTRYYANAEMSAVRLFQGEALVSGQLFVRYDAVDLGDVPNISIPFGC